MLSAVPPRPDRFFLSRRVIDDGTETVDRKEAACIIYCADPTSRDVKIATARSIHGSVDPGAVRDCLPPRRFLVAFSN